MDLLTRWVAAVTKTTSTPRKDSTLRYGSLFMAPLAADDSDNEFPVASGVLRRQKAAARNTDLKEVPPTIRSARGLLVNDQGKIWIPTKAVSMQVRLCHRSLWPRRTPRSPSDSNQYKIPLILEGHEKGRQGLCRLMLSLHC
jgi:hypothetical protein